MTGFIVIGVFRPTTGHLERQIESLQAQTLEDWRCLVGIDGADPVATRTAEVACADDPRFSVVEYDVNVGHFRHFERLLMSVPGDADWVALCDQDDAWYPTKLERLAPLLSSSSLVQGEALASSESTTRRASRHTDRGLAALLVDNQVTGSFAVVDTRLLEIALPFPAPTAAAYHDHWLAVCGHVVGGVTTLHEPLQMYRQHEENVVGEQVGGRLASRWRSLVAAAGTTRPDAVIDVVARERLAWRSAMARTILDRWDVRSEDGSVLDVFAAGTLSLELTRLVVRDIALRRVPPARALALLAAASWVKLVGRRI